MSHIVSLSFSLNSPMLSGYSEIPNNHFSVEFSIFNDMLDMLADIGHACLVYLCQLFLCKPQILIGKADRHPCYLVVVLIYDYSIFFFCHFFYNWEFLVIKILRFIIFNKK